MEGETLATEVIPWLIRQIYLEHGATYRKPQIIYRSKAEREVELMHS